VATATATATTTATATVAAVAAVATAVQGWTGEISATAFEGDIATAEATSDRVIGGHCGNGSIVIDEEVVVHKELLSSHVGYKVELFPSVLFRGLWAPFFLGPVREK
jgi:hypothetical protein